MADTLKAGAVWMDADGGGGGKKARPVADLSVWRHNAGTEALLSREKAPNQETDGGEAE